MKRKLILVLMIAICLALATGNVWAANVLCVKQLIENQPINEWRLQYNGYMTRVTLTRYYSGTPHTIVTCYRDFGVVSQNITKLCHLDHGEGQTVLVDEDVGKEVFECLFKKDSFKDSNDAACKVICE
jgi:hypothetical protein